MEGYKPQDFSFFHRSEKLVQQDIYLHYVGITRASKACYLIRGTYRRNFSDALKTAKDSEFLNINDLPSLRKDL